MPRSMVAADHCRIGIGRDDELPTGIGNGIDIGAVQHGTRADQCTTVERLGGILDRAQCLRRIERHLDHGDAGKTTRASQTSSVSGGGDAAK